ncbi:sodium:solute symporter family transporter [Bradyrhizobium genosp. A]|uniref:sodium:solute symporter family transporter n=1 Tax=Bradyrhizobium genosp. A TaxID=83626 RepID=UPI003CF51452
MNVSVVTIVVVVFYLAATFFVGWRGKRLASSDDMFNVFGRRAGTIRAASGYLSLIGGGELITICQMGYDNGLEVYFFLGGIAAGFLFLALFSERLRRIASERGVTTFSGLFGDLFGPSASTALTGVFVLSLGSLLSIQFIVGAQLIDSITGVPATVAALVMAAIIVAYLLAAGYVAVLSTDILRAVFMSLVLIIVVGFLFVYSRHIPPSNSFAPLGNLDRSTFFALGMFAVICAGDVWQTVFASKDRSTASRSLVIGAVCFLVFGGLIALIGVSTKAVVPEIAAGSSALIEAIRQVIPGALSPLMGLLIVGSVMATADTEIWVLSTSLLSSKLPSEARYASKSSPHAAFHAELARKTRLMLPVVTLVALVLAYLTQNAQALYQGMLVLLTSIAPVVFITMFVVLRKAAVVLSLWGGLISFLVLFGFFRAEVPLEYTFLPALISLLLLGVGMLVPTSRSDEDFASK